MKIKLLVATHKSYAFPDDLIYQPIEVGAVLRDVGLGYLRDDSEQNISDKNSSFCELTALYWAWKNNFFHDSSYCGLVHYRRYFKGQGEHIKEKQILSADEVVGYLKEYDIILPKKRHYFIESVQEHYANAHYAKDMAAMAELIAEKEPKYVEAFQQVMQSRSLHLFNMFVTTPAVFDAYMSWLFPLLFALEDKIDIAGYDAYQERVFGYIAERLFNVWIVKNDLRVKSLSVQNLDGENLVLKAIAMLKRKYIKKRL